MSHSQGAVCHLLVDGEVLHEKSAVHDLHDDDPNLHSQSAIHGLQTSAVHPDGDSHSLRSSPSASQAKLLRAANGLPPSPVHRMHSGLPAADVPDLHRRPTWSKLLELCDEIIRRMGKNACPLSEKWKVGEFLRRPSFVLVASLEFAAPRLSRLEPLALESSSHGSAVSERVEGRRLCR